MMIFGEVGWGQEDQVRAGVARLGAERPSGAGQLGPGGPDGRGDGGWGWQEGRWGRGSGGKQGQMTGEENRVQEGQMVVVGWWGRRRMAGGMSSRCGAARGQSKE